MNSMKSLVLNSAVLFSAKLMRSIYAISLSFLALAAVSFGDPQANVVPWSDDFETYTNLTPLIYGTNGWYGSSANIVVETNTVRSGINAAMIPLDCTLSNQFTNVAAANVWIQMDILPSFYNSTSTPAVDTNAAAMFYVDTNRNFVVVHGPETNATFNMATNWSAVTEVTIESNTWVRINMYQDFANTNWSLYADGLLVSNAIGFINPGRTNFTGFDVYNGASTSYMDNVSVVASATDSVPPLIVIPAKLSQNSLYAGAWPHVNPNSQTVKVVNVWGTDIGFLVRTNQDWVTAFLTNGTDRGTVTAGTTQDVVLTYTTSPNWVEGLSNATITVVATNSTSGDEYGTQTVQAVLNTLALSNVLYVTPIQFSHDVWRGATPTNRSFVVRNLGDLSFTYTVATGDFWIASSSNEGGLVAFGTNVLTLTNTVDTSTWPAGFPSNTWVDVVASNKEIMATQRITVAVNVSNISEMLEVMPMTLTSTVWRGDAPTNRFFVVTNKSDASFVYNVTTQEIWITNSLPGGEIPARSSVMGTLTYGRTENWQLPPVPSSSSWVRVATADGGGAATDLVATVNVLDFAPGTLQVDPLYFTNVVWIGDLPSNQTFKVWNTGEVSFVYAVATSAWISVSPTTDTIAARSTSTVTLAYRRTWGWQVGTSNATAIVTSANGAGATTNVAVTLLVERPALNYYVAINGADTNIPFPYTNWATAAQSLTAAVYKANFYTNEHTVVWVSNGLYTIRNQIPISNLTLRSVNGAESVTVTGRNTRGFYLAHTNAVLHGITISNCIAGRTTNGGAVFVSSGLVANCRLLNNTATNGGGVAVGAGGIVRNCLIWANRATNGNGGGVFFEPNTKVGSGLVENCTIASNYADKFGGGLFTDARATGIVVNCVVYSNMVGTGITNWGTNATGRLIFTNNCVTLPDVDNNGFDGTNNISGDPLFINIAIGNCRLANGSPCINAGKNNQAWMPDAYDLAGSVRLRFGTVDIGAYEWYPYQGMGIKVNGVRYENIRLINGAQPLRINGLQ